MLALVLMAVLWLVPALVLVQGLLLVHALVPVLALVLVLITELATPPPHFGDPVSPNQPETLAQISGFLIVVVKKTICPWSHVSVELVCAFVCFCPHDT